MLSRGYALIIAEEFSEWLMNISEKHNVNKEDIEELISQFLLCDICKNQMHRGDGNIYCATGNGECHFEKEVEE